MNIKVAAFTVSEKSINISPGSLLLPRCTFRRHYYILIDFSLTVKVTTLIFISGRGSAIHLLRNGNQGPLTRRHLKP